LDDTRVLITISQYAATRGAGAHEILGVFVNNGNQRKRRSRWKLADSAIEKAEKIKKIEKKEREKEREREREREREKETRTISPPAFVPVSSHAALATLM
jgi:hypothetical protein